MGKSKQATARAESAPPQKDEPAAEWVAPSELKPWAKNPRRNDGRPVEAVAESIRRFGFGAPIIARRSDRRVIAGHTRLKAAVKLGLERVPVRFVDVTDEQAAQLAVADNRTGEIAEWDVAMLAALAETVDMDGLGFSESELADLAAPLEAEDGGWGGVNTGGKAERAFVLSLQLFIEDVGRIEDALVLASESGTRTRGEALAAICTDWIARHDR